MQYIILLLKLAWEIALTLLIVCVVMVTVLLVTEIMLSIKTRRILKKGNRPTPHR